MQYSPEKCERMYWLKRGKNHKDEDINLKNMRNNEKRFCFVKWKEIMNFYFLFCKINKDFDFLSQIC